MKTILAIILSMYIAAAAGAEDAGLSGAPGAAGNQEQLIDQLLTVSGMKRSLRRLPAQTAAGLMQTAMKSEPSADEQRELVKAMEQAFHPDVFVDRVGMALKKNYDAQRYAHFVQLVSAPLARRMDDLEASEPNPEDVRAFISHIAKRPLSAERIKLIQRTDAATRSSALVTKMTIASIESAASAAGDDCSAAQAKIKKVIAKSRPEIEKANRKNIQMLLAFTYRDVSDADLEAYLKVYEDKDSRWVRDIIQGAIEEQFRPSMEQGARAVKKVVQAHKRKQTMFAPKCGQSESPNQDEPEQDEPVDEARTQEQAVAKPQVGKTAAPESKPVASESKIPVADGKPAVPANNVAVPQKKPAAERKVAALNQKTAVSHKRRVHRRAGPETDLRACLSLATNAEIIACAEK